MTDHEHDQPRELDAQGNPLATLAGPDPGNTDPEELTAPLAADDDVYALVEDEQRQIAMDQTQVLGHP